MTKSEISNADFKQVEARILAAYNLSDADYQAAFVYEVRAARRSRATQMFRAPSWSVMTQQSWRYLFYIENRGHMATLGLPHPQFSLFD